MDEPTITIKASDECGVACARHLYSLLRIAGDDAGAEIMRVKVRAFINWRDGVASERATPVPAGG